MITIAGTPLAGELNGNAWTFESGVTNSFLSDEDGFFTTLYPAPLTCTASHGDLDSILLSVPRAPGRYPLSLMNNITFVVTIDGETRNMVATSGVLEVAEVTDTTITGGLHAYLPGESYKVDGQFTATICP